MQALLSLLAKSGIYDIVIIKGDEHMDHKGTRSLETDRLLLRAFTPEDGDAMFRNWAHDAEVTRYLTWQPHADASVSRQIAEAWARGTANQDFYQWAIVPKELGEPIGSISVVHINEQYETAELGYCIGKTWWGQGLTAEALRAVVEYLIREVHFRKVSARHDVHNPNSGKVMRKAGMKQEGVIRHSGSNNSDSSCDLALYSILAEELDTPSPAFRPVARVKQTLSPEECIRILKQQKRGVLSVLGDGDYPYALPINHWYDPEDGKLYFHSGMTGHKIDAMRRWEKASFCVMEQAETADDGWSLFFHSVIVFGRLEIVEDHDRALEISRKLSYQFTDDREYIEWEVAHAGHRVLCFSLTPEHITGKRVHEK